MRPIESALFLSTLLVLTACSSSDGATSSASAGSGGMPSSSGAGGASGTASAGGSAGTMGAAGAAGGTVMGNCSPPADVFSPIEKLSLTGCVDPSDPRKPIAKAVSYEVNSPLWSDSADKQRAFLLPAGGKIHVRKCPTPDTTECPDGVADDGRWLFPVGSVMIKIFMFDDKLVETRLFMHVDDATWVGYSYQWDEAQTDATIMTPGRSEVMFDTGKRTVDWHYPSQQDCLSCHNSGAGFTLGPETAQLNRVVNGSNQIDQFTALDLFDTPPGKPYKAALTLPYDGQLGTAPADMTTEKARSYLHANCGFCHRPDGAFSNFDLRYDTGLKDTGICNQMVSKGTIDGSAATTILKPGSPMDSVMYLRMNVADPDKGRMPEIASYQVDASGTKVVGDWITSLKDADCTSNTP